MRALATAVLAITALLFAGCGRGDDSTAVACLEGQDLYLAALKKAPGEVRLAGETPISECLVENQSGGDLARVGEAMIESATLLNGEARSLPDGSAALRLGFLIGAAKRGAEETEGIHSDLIRRLTVAARYTTGGPLPAAFVAAYREGFDAGRAGG